MAAFDKSEGVKKVELPHNIILEGRERLSISGVEDVDSFDEASVVVHREVCPMSGA